MISEHQKIPSSAEIDERKAQMRRAVFAIGLAKSANSTRDLEPKEEIGAYSETAVSRLVNARRKRNEAAPHSVKHATVFPFGSQNDS